VQLTKAQAQTVAGAERGLGPVATLFSQHPDQTASLAGHVYAYEAKYFYVKVLQLTWQLFDCAENLINSIIFSDIDLHWQSKASIIF
jgi:hypothetical protein